MMQPKKGYAFPQWWNSDGDDPLQTANMITQAVANVENYNFRARQRNVVYARLAMGRDVPQSFGLSVSRRIGPMANQYRSMTYAEPIHNVVSLCGDTFQNLIGTNKPFIAPTTNGGDSNLRTKARKLRNIFQAQFSKMRLYEDILGQCFADCWTWGTAFCKVSHNLDRTDVVLERVLCDDIIINEVEGGLMPIHTLIHRKYMFRDDLLALYEDDDEAYSAIMNAPSAFPALSGQDINTDDIIYLMEAYKRPRPTFDFDAGREELYRDSSDTDKLASMKGVGRRVLCLPNFVLEDEPYVKDHFPFAEMRWKLMNIGYWGKGLPETMLQIQKNIQRIDNTIIQQQIHGSVFTVLTPKAAGLVPMFFGNKQGRVLQYDGVTPPTFHAPQAVNQEMYNNLEAELKRALDFCGLSPQATSGEKDPGVTAAVAMRTQMNQRDQRHARVASEQENFVARLAYLTLEVDKEIKPELFVGGEKEEVDWDSFTMEEGDIQLKAWPVSLLPSEPEAKLQTVSEWFANNQISKQEKMLLDDMPDTEAFSDDATAMRRYANWIIDEMLETGNYMAPDPYDQLDLLIQVAQSKLKAEQMLKTPTHLLRMIEQFIEQCDDLLRNPSALPTPQTQAPVGIQPPAVPIQQPGQALAPPPLQATPSIGAPPPGVQPQ